MALDGKMNYKLNNKTKGINKVNVTEFKKQLIENMVVGFEGYTKTKIYNMEESHKKSDTVELYARVNVACSRYERIMVDVVAELNLVSDKLKLKAVGKGSREHGRRAKDDLEYLIGELMQGVNRELVQAV